MKIMTPTPQKMINVTVRHKPPIEEQPAIQESIRAAEKELGELGRVLVRYSGTQAMCRVMVEGPTEEMTARLTKQIAAVVEKSLA